MMPCACIDSCFVVFSRAVFCLYELLKSLKLNLLLFFGCCRTDFFFLKQQSFFFLLLFCFSRKRLVFVAKMNLGVFFVFSRK